MSAPTWSLAYQIHPGPRALPVQSYTVTMPLAVKPRAVPIPAKIRPTVHKATLRKQPRMTRKITSYTRITVAAVFPVAQTGGPTQSNELTPYGMLGHHIPKVLTGMETACCFLPSPRVAPALDSM